MWPGGRAVPKDGGGEALAQEGRDHLCTGTVLSGRGDAVTPSVLRSKSITKISHEHHIYVIMHVMECVDNIFVI